MSLFNVRYHVFNYRTLVFLTETDGDMLAVICIAVPLQIFSVSLPMQPPICVGLYAQWGSGKLFSPRN